MQAGSVANARVLVRRNRVCNEPPPLPLADAIRQALVRRVDECGLCPGIVVGITDGGRHQIMAHGRAAASDHAVAGDTLFEIGSITKLFTALLLCMMAESDGLQLDAPVADLLPPGVRLPERGGARITLAHLATHTSGLPRLPDDIPLHHPDPYAGYTAERLYGFLGRYELARTPGEGYEYSNLGGGLLGHALAVSAGRDYADLLRERLIHPLGMTDTTIALTTEQAARLAAGHDESGDPVSGWEFGVLAGAGALRSTAHDLLRFVDALMDASGRLATAVATMMAPRSDGGLGFGLPQLDGATALQHDGGTGGYRSYLGCVPEWRRGSVVLTNASTGAAYDLGVHCCDPRWSLSWFRQPQSIDPASFDRLVGRYRMRPGLLFDVTRAGDRLMVQLTGQSASRVFPLDEWHMFYKSVGAQLTFEPGPGGRASRLILHQNNADRIAERIA